MKQAIFHLKSDRYNENTTLGNLYDPNGSHFCYTLEDTCRPYGIKVKKHTAIPATDGDFLYNLAIRQSEHYGKHVVIYTEIEESPKQGKIYRIKNGGIEFSYVLFHGGNDHLDTEGCILGNKHRDENKFKAWGSMKDAFTNRVEELISQGHEPKLRITRLPYSDQ